MIDLKDFLVQLDAIDYAAERLGYTVREVTRRTESIRQVVHQHPRASDIRQHVINLRGYDMPPQFDTHAWLDRHFERLIDQLASPAETAEIAELVARG